MAMPSLFFRTSVLVWPGTWSASAAPASASPAVKARRFGFNAISAGSLVVVGGGGSRRRSGYPLILGMRPRRSACSVGLNAPGPRHVELNGVSIGIAHDEGAGRPQGRNGTRVHSSPAVAQEAEALGNEVRAPEHQ